MAPTLVLPDVYASEDGDESEGSKENGREKGSREGKETEEEETEDSKWDEEQTPRPRTEEDNPLSMADLNQIRKVSPSL